MKLVLPYYVQGEKSVMPPDFKLWSCLGLNTKNDPRISMTGVKEAQVLYFLIYYPSPPLDFNISIGQVVQCEYSSENTGLDIYCNSRFTNDKALFEKLLTLCTSKMDVVKMRILFGKLEIWWLLLLMGPKKLNPMWTLWNDSTQPDSRWRSSQEFRICL